MFAVIVVVVFVSVAVPNSHTYICVFCVDVDRHTHKMLYVMHIYILFGCIPDKSNSKHGWRIQCLFVIPCTRQQWMDACKMMCCKCHWNKIPEPVYKTKYSKQKTHIRPIFSDKILPTSRFRFSKHEILNQTKRRK